MSTRVRAVGVCVASLALLAGCGGPVELADPDLPDAEARACADLIAALPTRLADQDEVDTEPADAPGAAWGDPPLVLECGVEVPTTFTETSSCLQVNEVGWFIDPEQENDPGTEAVFTAVGYRPVVRLVVPPDQRGEVSAAALAELATPVTEHLDLVQPCL